MSDVFLKIINVKLNSCIQNTSNVLTIFLLEWRAPTDEVDAICVSSCDNIKIPYTTFSGDGVESSSLSCKLSESKHDQPCDG